MKKFTKLNGQMIHAKKRFSQRYGGEISNSQLSDLVSDVKKGFCQHISKVTNRLSVFKSGDWIFVYDKHRKSIATFLTEDMVENYIKIEKQNDVRRQRIRQAEAQKIESINQEVMEVFGVK